MKLIRLVLLFLIISVNHLVAQSAHSEQRSALKGNAKSVLVKSFAAKGRHHHVRKGKPRHEYIWESDYSMIFDSSGNLVQKLTYLKNGALFRDVHYWYDAHGFITKEVTLNPEGRAIDSTVYTNQYNVSGQIVKRVVKYSGNEKENTFIFQHDADGNVYESVVIGDDTPPQTNNIRRYDKNWRMTNWWTYTKDNKPDTRHVYTYDAIGRITSDSVFQPWDKPAIIYRWKYADDGTLLRKEICTTAGVNCEAWTYEYEYDKTGNWIKLIEYRNGKPVFIKERTITYY